MAVTFTTNIGLAMPDETEMSKEWARNSKLAEDNNNIIADKMDITLTSYTPTLTAQTTPPSVGAGSIAGEYQDIEGFIMGGFVIKFTDPGVAVGSGEYAISLPFPVDGSFHSVGTAFNSTPGPFSVVGEGYFSDSSAVATSGSLALDVVTVTGVSYVRLLTQAFTGKTARFVTNTQPVAVATADRIIGNYFYKKA